MSGYAAAARADGFQWAISESGQDYLAYHSIGIHVCEVTTGAPLCGAETISGPIYSHGYTPEEIRASLGSWARHAELMDDPGVCEECVRHPAWQEPRTVVSGPLAASDRLGTPSLLDLLEGVAS